jgi:hypothetical protein
MDYKLRFSSEFYNNLDDAMDYAINTLDNPKFAYNLWNMAHEKANLIEKQPFMFPLHHNESIAAKGFRYTIVFDYLLFYHVNEKDGIITIESLVYGRRNLTEIFV